LKHLSCLCKRVLDLILVIPILIFLSPVLICLCAGYAVSIIFFPEDRGPIFHRNFRKTRGRLFLIYKFRISRISHLRKQRLPQDTIHRILSGLTLEEKIRFEKHPEFHVEDGGTVKTRFGAFIKKFYLDEVPQLMNIIKGDMTFVGPRPFSLSDIRNLPDAEGKVTIKGQGVDYTFKNELMSGLTGYYQLNKDYRALDDYMQFVLEGVELDRQYYDKIKQISCFRLLLLDISIIVRSIAVVVRAEGI
jgi:lipopolysaccharide/colanic/teichoic acid biosynthesis glycosyltransferase